MKRISLGIVIAAAMAAILCIGCETEDSAERSAPEVTEVTEVIEVTEATEEFDDGIEEDTISPDSLRKTTSAGNVTEPTVTTAAVPEPEIEPETEYVPPAEEITEPERDVIPVTSSYVLNNNTMRIHKPDCKSVDEMKPENREDVTGELSDFTAKGYKPCGICLR